MAATMSEIDRLVLAPFREIVEKANTALENAKDADEEVAAPMQKAAHNLAKEGERALKRIEPLCENNYNEYGANFIDAIKEHDDIAQFRSELDDLLWDFDDFVEPDEFDAEKFEELQKTSRKVAPKLVDILRRMKLEKPASAPEPAEPMRDVHRAVESPTSTNRTMDEVEQQLSQMLIMGTQAGPDLGVDAHPEMRALSRASQPTSDISNLSHRSDLPERPLEPPPRPPSADPWLVDRPPPLSPGGRSDDSSPVERRPMVVGGDSPTLPLSVAVGSPRNSASNSQRNSRWAGSDTSRRSLWRDSTQTAVSGMDGRLRADSLTKRPAYTNFSLPEPPRYSSQFSDAAPSEASRSPPGPHFIKPAPMIPEDIAVGMYTTQPGRNSIMKILPPRGASLGIPLDHHAERQPSMESLNSSVFDCVTFDGTTSPVTSTQRTSSVTSTTPVSPYSPGGVLPLYSPNPPNYATNPAMRFHLPVGGTLANHSTTTVATIQARSPTTSEGTVAPLPQLLPPFEDAGLIPVDAENREEPSMPARQPDCSIGPHSSFYQMKGFCKGAEEIMRGELGFKQMRRPVGGYSHTVVAKCTNCSYELDFDTVTRDLNNELEGNFTSSGVGFRLRLLQKSHLPTKHVEEQLYGCMFCIHEGKTLDESDATVFFNQKQLFAHIARHPRPLPIVTGITVIEDVESPADIPPPFRHNFDLHLPPSVPPVQSIMSGIAREVGRLPTAIATETRRSVNNVMRAPPDRAHPLQYAVGARIVGIEFPAKYDGKWGVGWHDGVRAAFELDSVRLEAPPRSETRMGGSVGNSAASIMSGVSGGSGNHTNVQAMARWKWSQKGEGNWLKFDKGEVIRNINWVYNDHWCWSGTVGKNNTYGIFPQSHLEPNSIRAVRPDEASISSGERGKSSGLGRFSIRKNHHGTGDSKKDKKDAKVKEKKIKAKEKESASAVAAERKWGAMSLSVGTIS